MIGDMGRMLDVRPRTCTYGATGSAMVMLGKNTADVLGPLWLASGSALLMHCVGVSFAPWLWLWEACLYSLYDHRATAIISQNGESFERQPTNRDKGN